MILNKINSIKDGWLESSCDGDYSRFFGIHIDHIAAVSDGGVDMPLFINDPP